MLLIIARVVVVLLLLLLLLQLFLRTSYSSRLVIVSTNAPFPLLNPGLVRLRGDRDLRAHLWPPRHRGKGHSAAGGEGVEGGGRGGGGT